jgi:hypothetical protein
VYGFANDLSIERVHLQFCKKILGAKKQYKMTAIMEN